MISKIPFVMAIVSKVFGNGKSLSQGKIYPVVEVSDDSYRVIDDRDAPALFPRSYFLEQFIEPPIDWIKEDFDDREYVATPKELNIPGLIEDYFDYKPEAIAIIKSFIEEISHLERPKPSDEWNP